MDAWLVALLAGAVLCAIQAIRAARLLAAAIWLAGVSTSVALVLYLLGAPQVAVIELSVGAGLVTVLFVFAINIAGEDTMTGRALLPRPLALGLVIAAALLLAVMTLPALAPPAPSPETLEAFGPVLWEQRGLDVLLHLVLIFGGVLGVLGLLGEGTVQTLQPTVAESIPAEAPDEPTDALEPIPTLEDEEIPG